MIKTVKTSPLLLRWTCSFKNQLTVNCHTSTVQLYDNKTSGLKYSATKNRHPNKSSRLYAHETASSLSWVTTSGIGDKLFSTAALNVSNNREFPQTWRLYSTTALGWTSSSAGSLQKKGSMVVNGEKTERRSKPDQSSRASSSASGKGREPAMIEAVVCSTEDLQDGQMKEVQLGDHKVLLVKDKGQFYATGNKCTHYGAPLSKGSYCNGVVRCPWHGACFSVKTGDIEDFPGLDSLHTFQVDVRGKDVVVKADPAALENFRRVRPMTKQVSSDKSVVIVGGGPASVVCAETLRQEGFTGKITLVSKEDNLPYDRIKLSKTLSIKADEIMLRKSSFYEDNGINLLLGKEVLKVEPAENHVILSDGESLAYTSLVLATGGRPRKSEIPGSDLSNVFVLRTVKDANNIAEKIKDKHVLVLGSSFIGLEVACFMTGKAASVSVVGRSSVPLAHVFGPSIGEWFKKLHESKGVKFYSNTSVSAFEGKDGVLTSATLADGTTVQADICVVGIGVVPCTEFLKTSGLEMTSRGFVSVDKNMRTNVPNVYAAGDITEFPLACERDNPVNIQHWQMAHQHGRTAGLDIAGKGRPITSVPYFWTVQFGKSVRYAGHHQGYDDMILHGELDQNKFLAYYIKSNQVIAAASLGWDPLVSQFAQLLASGRKLSAEDVRNDPTSWTEKAFNCT